MIRLNFRRLIRAVCVALALVIICACCNLNVYAAPTTAASNALSDLRKDASFDVGYYPANSNDYGLNLIQVAEGTGGELFIYVYQPAAPSLTGEADSFKLYALTFLNVSGTIHKYRVNGLKLNTASERDYYIASIYRPFDGKIDKKPTDGQTVSEIAVRVGQKWTAATQSDNSVTYSMIYADVVTIIDKYCDFIRYPQGVKWNSAYAACDGHFVAFTSDHDMDKLLAARVSFTEQTYKKTLTSETTGEVVKNEKYIEHDQYAEADVMVLGFKRGRKWQRIQTGKEFAKSAPDLSDGDRKKLSNYQYVLNFYETPYEGMTGSLWFLAGALLATPLLIPAIKSLNNASGTVVNDVSILELTFEKDGQTYSLGVVDNKQGGEPLPVGGNGNKSWFDKFAEWLADKLNIPVWAAKAIIIGVPLLILLAIALPVLSVIFPAFGQVLKGVVIVIGKGLLWLLKGIWWLVCLPFKAIAAIVNKCKSRKPKPKTGAKTNGEDYVKETRTKTKQKSRKLYAKKQRERKERARNAKTQGRRQG